MKNNTLSTLVIRLGVAFATVTGNEGFFNQNTQATNK